MLDFLCFGLQLFGIALPFVLGLHDHEQTYAPQETGKEIPGSDARQAQHDGVRVCISAITVDTVDRSVGATLGSEHGAW